MYAKIYLLGHLLQTDQVSNVVKLLDCTWSRMRVMVLTWSRSSALSMPSARRCSSVVGSQMCAGTLRCVMSFPTKSLMIDQILKLGVASAGSGNLVLRLGILPWSVCNQSVFQAVRYTRASGDLPYKFTLRNIHDAIGYISQKQGGPIVYKQQYSNTRGTGYGLNPWSSLQLVCKASYTL